MTPEVFDKANEIHEEQQRAKDRLKIIINHKHARTQIKIGGYRLFDEELDPAIYDMAIGRLENKIKELETLFKKL